MGPAGWGPGCHSAAACLSPPAISLAPGPWGRTVSGAGEDLIPKNSVLEGNAADQRGKCKGQGSKWFPLALSPLCIPWVNHQPLCLHTQSPLSLFLTFFLQLLALYLLCTQSPARCGSMQLYLACGKQFIIHSRKV